MIGKIKTGRKYGNMIGLHNWQEVDCLIDLSRNLKINAEFFFQIVDISLPTHLFSNENLLCLRQRFKIFRNSFSLYIYIFFFLYNKQKYVANNFNYCHALNISLLKFDYHFFSCWLAFLFHCHRLWDDFLCKPIWTEYVQSHKFNERSIKFFIIVRVTRFLYCF